MESVAAPRREANNHSDAYFHLATGTLFAIVAAVQIVQDRTASR